MNTKTVTVNLVPIALIATLLLTLLKGSGFIGVSWWVVFSPLLFLCMFIILVCTFVLILMMIVLSK